MLSRLLVRFYVLRHNTDLIKDSLRSILAARHQLTQMYWPIPVESTEQCEVHQPRAYCVCVVEGVCVCARVCCASESGSRC